MRSLTILLIGCLGLGLSSAPATGQKVVFHGYVTQGLGSTSEYAQAGLETGTSLDIRAAALQGRLMFPSFGTQFVVQGAHRRVGGSPVADVIDEVELDWAFVEQRVWDLSARIGRVPMPKGLLNEVRDVGIILPFYRAPNAYYTEGVETIDGATAGFSRLFGMVEVDAQGFYGTIPVIMQISAMDGPKAMDLDGEGTWGGQLAVGLPLRGVKVLGGMLDADITRTEYTPMGPVTSKRDWKMSWIGAEYAGDRVVARAEVNRNEVPASTESGGRYVQTGARVFRNLWLNAQYESGWVRIIPLDNMEYDTTRDWVVGASYGLNRYLVFKGEHHWSEGYNVDESVNIMGPPVDNRYFLFSISAAF